MPRLFAGLLVLIGWTGPVFALDNPLDAIPEDAGVVIRLKNSRESSTKLMDFANRVDPGIGFFAAPLIQGMGILISNQTLEGVDRTSDWWVAVFPSAEAEPGLVFGVRAKDAEKLERAVGAGYHFAKADDWVFYSETQGALERIEGRLSGQGKSIDTLIDAESRAVLERGDLSVFVNLAQLKTIYHDAIGAGKEEAKSFLERGQRFLNRLSGTENTDAGEANEKVIESTFRRIEDARTATAGLVIAESSLDLETYVSFAADSETGELLKKHPASALTLVTKLPPGRLGYVGIQGDLRELVEFAMGHATHLLAGDEKSAAKFEALEKDLRELQYGGYVVSVGISDAKSAVLQSDAVTEVKPAEKVREITRRAVEVFNGVAQQGVQRTVALQPDAEKHGERTADVLTFKQEFDNAIDPSGARNRVLNLMFGPEGLAERLVYLDDKVVQTIGGGPEAMDAALKSLESKDAENAPADNADLREVRSQLAQTANILGFVDLPSLAAKSALLAKESGQLNVPLDKETLDRLQIERSYLGFSVTAEPHALRTKVCIPSTQLAGVLKLGLLLQSIRSSLPLGESGGD